MRMLRWLGYVLAAIILFIVFLVAFLNWLALHRETEDRVAAASKSGHFVHAADVDVFIQEAGSKSGPAVVLMHAAGGWSGVWKETMKALAKDGFHAICFRQGHLADSLAGNRQAPRWASSRAIRNAPGHCSAHSTP